MNSVEIKPIFLWAPIWGALLLLGWVLYQSTPSSQTQVQLATPTTVVINGEPYLKIAADDMGQYRFKGKINNKVFAFLIDTGASSVALPKSVADQLLLIKGPDIRVTTASGQAQGYRTLLNSVTIDQAEFSGIEAIVIGAMPGNEILLGMSLLKSTAFHHDAGYFYIRYPSQLVK